MWADHQLFVATLLRELIDEVDEYYKQLKAEHEAERADEEEVECQGRSSTQEPRPTRSKRVIAGHVTLGGRQKPVSLREYEATHITLDPCFSGFRLRLGNWLTATLPRLGVDLGGRPVSLNAQDEV